jgi:hypothetical protein
MKAGLLLLAAFLLAGCAADGVTRLDGEVEGWGELPDFRSPLLFPGEVTGIEMNLLGATLLRENEFCLHVDEGVLGDPLASGLPVEIMANARLLTADEISVRRDEGAGRVVYCAAPLLEIGTHTIDIDLNTVDGLQVYRYRFANNRVTGWRPLSMYPGEVTGMAFEPGDPAVMRQSDDVVCWLTNERVLPSDVSLARVLDVRLDGAMIEPEWIESQDRILETCFILNLEPGTYSMEAVLRVADVEPGEVLPVVMEEWYRWELHVDEHLR